MTERKFRSRLVRRSLPKNQVEPLHNFSVWHSDPEGTCGAWKNDCAGFSFAESDVIERHSNRHTTGGHEL